jgi:hypothetical protein
MFVVTEADAAAIRAAFERGGELSAEVELRRCARTIAGRKPPAVPVRRRLRRRVN